MKYRYMRFPNGKARALTLSYDDGSVYDIKLAEILARFGIKATFNITGAPFINGKDGWHMTADEVKQSILPYGNEIAIHGQRHIAPGCVTAVEGINDILECRKTLERAFGGIIRGMAYPDSGITRLIGGASLEDIEAYIKMLGIAYSRTLGGDNCRFEMPADWLRWMPSAHHTNPKLFEYLDLFLKDGNTDTLPKGEPKLFYLWGHSFEFENNKNWELIEEFCRKASGREDIWYATNIEIYDYAAAYRSLRFNVDNTRVFNPTLYEVWFYSDGEIYSVRSGETLELK
ncbi:MAG: polysaccharide deacetylase family protein [Acutalibacteraceae bacterium]